MDVSSIRSLVIVVIQLQTIIIFAQALSEEGEGPKTKSRAGGSGHRQQRPCCYNGGTCYLGSFCACPKNFYGRKCEHRVSARSCRSIPHGSWLKAGCNLCRCVDGYMTCLPRAFDGCDDKPVTEEEPDNIWDYEDQMIVFASGQTTTPPLYDAEDAEYYEYYDGGGGGHSLSSRTMASACVVALGGAVVAVYRTVLTSASWVS